MSELRVSVQSKRFEGASEEVLRNIEFTAQRGEFVALLGPSGCGKSTLLNLVAELDRDYEGSISFNDKPVHDIRLGYVFQDARLLPWLTVQQNVELVLHDSAESVARNALREVGLDGARQQYPVQLSGGMQRRVALARACSIEPELLLLDEPFVSLDAPTAGRLRAQLLELWQRYQPTVIYVTHDLSEALLLADRVICLSQKPAQIVDDHAVDIQRPRTATSEDVARLRSRLMEKHYDLLADTVA